MESNLLQKGLEALSLSPSPEQLGQLETMVDEIMLFNPAYRLVSNTDRTEIIIRHVLDSASALAYFIQKGKTEIIDLGTGAGFPGLPMLIARPDLDITFLDSVGKKLAFINDVLKQSGLVGQTLHARAEEIAHDADYREQFDFAVSRAVAPLNILAEYAMPLIKVGGTFIAMKGAEDEAELGANAVQTLGGKIEQVVYLKLPNDDTRNLVVIKKLSQTPSKYPRRTKKITSKPL